MNKFALILLRCCLCLLFAVTARARVAGSENEDFHVDALMHSKNSDAVLRLRTGRLENEQVGKSCKAEMVAQTIPINCYRVLSESKAVAAGRDLNGLSLKMLDKRCRLISHSLYNADVLRESVLERSISADCRRALNDRISELDYMKIN